MLTNDKCWLKDNCNHKDCDKFCMRFFKLNTLYEEALISLYQRKHINFVLDANNTDKEAFDKLIDIQKNINTFISEGKNLYIHSVNTGNGKTGWALRLIQTYFNNIWPSADLKCKALFIHVPTFLLALKDNLSQKSDYIKHIKENVLNCDIVIWDEVGTKTSTPFEMENLLSIINGRLNSCKSNIYTSNLSGEELCDKIGERLYSRIINISEDIEFRSFDKRGLTI